MTSRLSGDACPVNGARYHGTRWFVLHELPSADVLHPRGAHRPAKARHGCVSRRSAHRSPLAPSSSTFYDSTETVLVEVSATGDVVTSGFRMPSGTGDRFAWHGERLSEERFEAAFRLHPFQDVIASAELADDRAERLARRFGGTNAAYCSNLVSVDTLISHAPLAAKGGETLYFRWRGASRHRFPAAASWEAHRASLPITPS